MAEIKVSIFKAQFFGAFPGICNQEWRYLGFVENAKIGMVQVYAAGNNGYRGRNTIGSPAIAAYKNRLIAVAATDANKNVARYSSKGKGSRVTSRGDEWKDHPVRPDIGGLGSDREGPWPTYMSSSRTDPKYGPVRAISGTYMITPEIAGVIAMLAQLFGVTERGEALDRIIKAVYDSVDTMTGQEDWEIGRGFVDAWAAYQSLVAVGISPARPNWIVRFSIWALDKKPVQTGPPNPIPAAPPRPK